MAELAACHIVGLAEQPMCCDLDPSVDLLLTGLVSGKAVVNKYSYDVDANPKERISSKEVISLAAHTEGQSCRAARFMPNGVGAIVTGGEDLHMVVSNLETGKQIWKQENAHDAAISMLRVLSPPSLQAPVCVSGDENGGVKVWDTRQRKQVMSYKKHKDFISDAALQVHEQSLAVCSGDGTLSIHDLRTNRFVARSEDDADDDLLSLALVKNGRKIVCGTGSGVLAIWSWGYWNDCSDRYPGHPESVDAMVAFDESTVFTGSSDGLVRIVSLFPNKLLGVLGAHEDLPVEHMALSHDKKVLASTSHDEVVRLWDLSILHEDDDGDDVEEEGEGDDDSDLVGGSGEDQGDQALHAGSDQDQEVGEDEDSDFEDSDFDSEHDNDNDSSDRESMDPGEEVGTDEDKDENDKDSSSGMSEDDGDGKDGEGSGKGAGGGSAVKGKGRQKRPGPVKGVGSAREAKKAKLIEEMLGDKVVSSGTAKQGAKKGKSAAGVGAKKAGGRAGKDSEAEGAAGSDSGAEEDAKQQPSTSTGKAATPSQSKQKQAGKKGLAALKQQKLAQKGDSDGSDADSDDSDDEGKRSKGKNKRERTKWASCADKQKPKSNFFDGLL